MNSKPERRASPRIAGSLKVLVQDPVDALEGQFLAWVVDRSDGGVCLAFENGLIEEGNVLMVMPFSPSAKGPWIEVLVKHRRQKERTLEFGCAFLQTNGWEKELLRRLPAG